MTTPESIPRVLVPRPPSFSNIQGCVVCWHGNQQTDVSLRNSTCGLTIFSNKPHSSPNEIMLEKFHLKNCPGNAYYIQNFLTMEEEQLLLNSVNNVPQTKWTQLSRRRLQNWGGVPHPNGMVPEAIPQWLQNCIDKVAKFQAFLCPPNHVLINEYKPNEGIMPHLDGPLYSATIATVNLGSHTVLNFYNAEERDKIAFSLFLEPRSLLIQQGDMYENYLHGIDEKDEDVVDDSMVNMCNSDFFNQSLRRGTRVSLTIRHVKKISKIKIKLGR